MSAEEYISLYKELAVVNMKEKKVPASITLAQAIFESDCGNSPLAHNANNHFGIKCHTTWNGDTYHQDDDERDECFRKYENPLLSFEDHSDFLHNRERYDFLFSLDITDYKGWARGLKKAGYATNPEYAFKLIDLIERYNLNLLDEGKDLPVCKEGSSAKNVAVNEKSRREEEKKIISEEKNTSVASSNNTEPVTNTRKESLFYKEPALAPAGYINEVPYMIAEKGDTWFSISKKKEMMLWQVLKYNDADKNDVLKEGMIIYLKPKRTIAQQESHIAKDGDSLWSISQQYGVKLSKLYRCNNMMPGQSVSTGQKINLK
ncbi:MAG: glucosaminidase domain-containing protein [Bacteroidota bacterium]